MHIPPKIRMLSNMLRTAQVAEQPALAFGYGCTVPSATVIASAMHLFVF